MMNNLILKLFAIAIIGVCGADDISSSAVAGVSKKKISNHLPSIRHETFANAIDILRVRRLVVQKLFSKSSKADGKSGKADSISTKSDKANKSAKAYSKGQKEEEEGVTTYGYKLEQSTDQESVVALESLMEDGKDSVAVDHCSMFIDV